MFWSLPCSQRLVTWPHARLRFQGELSRSWWFQAQVAKSRDAFSSVHLTGASEITPHLTGEKEQRSGAQVRGR